jgi:putative nucleotidyltransferase with HDIG domain
VSVFRRFAVPLNLLVILVTMVFVGAALVVGRAAAKPSITLQVGEPSPMTFVATRGVEVPDALATEQERTQEALAVQTIYKRDTDNIRNIRATLVNFLEALRQGAFEPVSTEPTVPTPPTDSSTTSSSEATSSTDVAGPTQDTGAADTTSTTVAESTTSTSTTTTLPRVALEDQTLALQEDFAYLSNAIPVFVEFYNLSLDQVAEGGTDFWPRVESQLTTIVENILSDDIKADDLVDIKNNLLQQPRQIFIAELDSDQRGQLAEAAATLVANIIQPTVTVDENATAEARQAARDAVKEQSAQFFPGQQIAAVGDTLTKVQIDAINELGLIEPEKVASRRAIVLLGALAVALAAFFLWRLAPGQWSAPKHFALLGILLVLAALASRLPELVNTADGEVTQLGFAIPAMLFGYVAAILYDPRTAVLMAVPVTTFVAIATADPALTVFAAVATVTPVAFVSAVSSRRELRVAVALSAVVLAPFAAVISWLFRGYDTYPEAALFAVLGGLLAGMVAQALVSFLENLFRMTTTLTLLDLVDRNHPALRLIEEKAPGTFNHSMLVGTLAGKAARAIGASPLLAQADAFYHDLGKTENPVYFIENQFSISNPHDQLDPVESAKILRAHVTDGLRLARQYRLPPEVAAGIRSHHGTGLMRYFYHQALEADPDVDPQLFRHHGEKPKRKETAILMICDAVEGAARAHAQEQDPTAESIAKVVDAVVGEKLDDGQLDESDLTFGDLTKVKAALVDSLVGYYHTRVPYPGFPGPRAAGS